MSKLGAFLAFFAQSAVEEAGFTYDAVIEEEDRCAVRVMLPSSIDLYKIWITRGEVIAAMETRDAGAISDISCKPNSPPY